MMRISFCRSASALILALAAFSGPARAQTASGAIHLAVDATQAPQKILHVAETIPVQQGPLTLYYPAWIPGEHAPDGPIVNVAGLEMSAAGRPLHWRRDLVDMFAFHVEVPAGVSALDVKFDFLLSAPAAGFSSGASATGQLDLLSWNQVLLYPKGFTANALTFVPSLRLPDGWKFGTPLPIAHQSGAEIEFSPVSLEMLVDAPVISGRFYRVVDLSPGQSPPHEIDIAADSEAALAMPAEMEQHYKNLVAETGALFGSRHYRDYHFLLTLSDDTAHFGLEHHESSDDRVAERSLTDDMLRLNASGLLPHEFTHSWNGKFRRPADLATPDYQQPMKDDLLWVYEGLTQYLGDVLTVRSGLYTPEQYHDYLAGIAAELNEQTGRTWRPLQDTADAAQLLYFAPNEWANWRRGVDYYDEGLLIWLEVDTRIRQLTHNQKSLDDFCHAFHGGPGGKPELETYTFDDVVATLNGVVAYDWRALLTERLTSTDARAPLGGIDNGGWKLVYNDTPNALMSASDYARRQLNYRDSVGLLLTEDGSVIDVFHDGAAYKAGVGPGMRIHAVNAQAFTPEVFREAIAATKNSAAPLNLLLANGAYLKNYAVDYHGGLRYPHLERVEGKQDLLADISRPHAH